jgi:hypothetical protein
LKNAALDGDWNGLLRSGAIVAGLALTITGYLAGLVQIGLAARRRGGTAGHSVELPDEPVFGPTNR